MCLQIGIDDPKAWLDSAPDEVVDLWDAYYRLEPWGGEYQRHAELMEMMDALFAVEVNKHIPKGQPKYEQRPRRQFMPADYAGETLKAKRKAAPIADQFEQYAKAIMNRKV